MKKNKVILTRTGEEYTCKYLLDAADIVDTKVDMGMSGRFPQIIPYTLEEKDGQRTFVYQIGERMQMTEFLKKEINKKQMLTLLYNVLSALETFGMNMISLSYVAKDIQYIFVNPETLEVSFIVAGVDKEITDLNEVRDFVKAIICDATYFEMDRDNYVARLISFTNRRGTFSISDMKKYVDNLLLDMGIHIEEEKKQEVKENKTTADKVSRVGVMQNQAKMAQPVAPMSNGQPMPNRPMPMQMGPDGKPIVPPISNRPMNGAAPMPEKKPEAAPVPPMPEKKPETAPVPPMPEQKTDAPKPQAPVPYLLRTATNEKIYINKPEFAIGRSATKADYTVTDNSDVSRIHCIIERKNGVSYIKDNQSTNGTYVNGKNIAGQENVFLTNNAKVSLGDEEFVYHIR